MHIILDTHLFLWSLSAPQKIPKGQRVEIESRTNVIYLSSISIAEIMIKASLGKLDIDFDPLEQAESAGFELLDFRGCDAMILQEMPFHHKDPFDRMLIAQGLVNGFSIMTNDAKFARYDCELV